MPHGKLDVYVEGAVQIKDTAIIGKGSPYCTLTMGTQEFSSPPVAEGGTRPFFNTKFEFQVDPTTEQLMVKIFRKSALTDDDLLGYCIISFQDAFYHSHVLPVTAYALTRPSGRPGGHIHLSLTFQSQPPPRLVRPYRQPRPVTAPGLQYRQPHPPPPHQQHLRPPRNNMAGPSDAGPPYPHDLPRRMDQEDSSSQSSRCDSDEDPEAPAPYPYPPYQYQQPPPRGRGRRPGPPPVHGRPLGPNQAVRAPAPPNNNNVFQNFGGALMQNLGGALVGSVLSYDGDGLDWGGGGDGDGDGDWGGGDGDSGQVETASYGSSAAYEEEQGYYGSYSAVEEVEYVETDEGVAPQTVGVYAGSPARGRGRGRGPARGRVGPPGQAGPPIGRAGMMPGPGRGARGRRPPPMARGGRPPMARGGGPPPM